MPQFRRLARNEVGEEFPDGIARGRAAGNEVIDLHHFVQRMHLVQRQRQFRVVRDMTVHQTWFGEIHLGQATAQVEMIALCRQAAVDGAGADGNEDFAVFAEFAQHMHVLCIADTTFDEADVARPAVLDVGDAVNGRTRPDRAAETGVRRCRVRTCGSRSNRRAKSSQYASFFFSLMLSSLSVGVAHRPEPVH